MACDLTRGLTSPGRFRALSRPGPEPLPIPPPPLASPPACPQPQPSGVALDPFQAQRGREEAPSLPSSTLGSLWCVASCL